MAGSPPVNEQGYINSYADARTAGNTLLRLPLELRQDIFEYAAMGYARDQDCWDSLEAADMRQGRQISWLPPMCVVDDAFFIESVPMFLKQANIVVREVYTAYNLRFFLQATDTFASVQSLRFIRAEALTPLSAGAALLEDCINLRDLSLSFRFDDFNFPKRLNYAPAPSGDLNKKWFADAYAFRHILKLKSVKRITLFAVPSPLPRELFPVGVESFWGIKPWLEKKFEKRGMKVQIASRIGCESS
ncbi:hypothetical protein BU26DRAFT_184460 [Trematosphaeria pertusa]|uniref:Uncharacterized protein n=1 Tax=Trematosphaeria pertusa TaxID=390896 RepID=A0A6A6HS38_9PLEO|nr:uncharacterized protein BU26DRAFT_184460 [Trematosphaeria pertusa]KAF2240916.1 hypothetical protein BU26DRAFT_184460 [Trematosphaeria pertusa]